MFDPSLGSQRGNRVNLSTGGASSSSSLLENVRAERQLREERIRQEKAALVIQRKWRALQEGLAVRRTLLSQLDELVDSDVVSSEEVERRARSLAIMGRWRGPEAMRNKVDRLFVGLVKSGREVDPSESCFKSPICGGIFADDLYRLCIDKTPSTSAEGSKLCSYLSFDTTPSTSDRRARSRVSDRLHGIEEFS